MSIETADGPAFTLAGVFDDPKYARDRQGAQIIGQLSYARSWGAKGAKFVVPIPEVTIIP